MNEYINALLNYAVEKGIMKDEDAVYSANRILALLNLDEFERDEKVKKELKEILDNIFSYAKEDKKEYREILESKIMDCLMPRPSEVIDKFNEIYKISKKDATSYLYNLGVNSDYIKTDKLKENITYNVDSEYGKLGITINVAKPDKDIKLSAMAKKDADAEYPKCPICYENVGHTGSLTKAPRNNHRVVPIILKDEKWYLQFPPYICYTEHCIVLKKTHDEMKISKDTFMRLLEFVEMFPHYFAGSNSDLPLVGATILNHDHFQGGAYHFPLFDAKKIKEYEITNYEDIEVELLNWPMLCLKLTSDSKARLAELGEKILEKWVKFSDEKYEIYGKKGNERYSTLIPIVKKKDEDFEMYLVFRNNLTDTKYPQGIFNVDKKYQFIKKENIGICEAMGLAILPGKLKDELLEMEDAILSKKVDKLNTNCKAIAKEIIEENEVINKDNISMIMKEKIGNIYIEILKECNVLKFVDEKHYDKEIEKFLQTIR